MANQDTRTRPNLDGIAHPDVARAVRESYTAIYDLQDGVLALKKQFDLSLLPLTIIGVIDGVNTLFQIKSQPATVRLFLGGMLQATPGDYSYSGGRIVMTTPPL